MRRQLHDLTSISLGFSPQRRLDSWTVTDPYGHPGEYHKAQLHLHTANSRDVREKKPVVETLRAYREAGYRFLAITDHDTVTEIEGSETGDLGDLVVVAGIEETLGSISWPLGKHLVRLGLLPSAPGDPRKRARFRFAAPAHLSWQGNLETGCWHLDDLRRLADFQLIEIYNEKSDSQLDLWLWHKLLQERGPQKPLWGIAVDDSDNAVPLDRGWIMIKTTEISEEAFLDALARGSFYATTGPRADFWTEGGAIHAASEDGLFIRFFGGRNEAVAVFRGSSGSYRPSGNEGFIRIEVTGRNGRRAWSQPFFLVDSGKAPRASLPAASEQKRVLLDRDQDDSPDKVQIISKIDIFVCKRLIGKSI